MGHRITDEELPDALRKILDRLVSRPRWQAAMSAIGYSEQSAFIFLNRSRAAEKQNDTSSPYYLEWRETFDFFHVHCRRARAESVIVYEHLIRDQCMFGIESPIIEDGREVYRLNPEFLGVSDDAMRDALLDPVRDRWLWNVNAAGERTTPQVLMRTEQVPGALRARVLAGLLPDTYGEHSTHDVRVQGGVMIVGGDAPRLPATPQRALPAPSQEDRPDIAELKRQARELALHGPKHRQTAPLAPGVVQRIEPNDRPDDVPLGKPTVPLEQNRRAYQAPPYARHVDNDPQAQPEPQKRQHATPDRQRGTRVC